MGKLIRWVTLGAALCCLVFISIYYVENPNSIFQINAKNLRGILLAIAMIILICRAAASLFGTDPIRNNNTKNTPADSAWTGKHRPIESAGRGEDPIKAALRNNPVLTLILILFGISLPIVFQLSAPRLGRRQFTTEDWTSIAIGEALIAIVFVVAWYRVKRRTQKNGDHP